MKNKLFDSRTLILMAIICLPFFTSAQDSTTNTKPGGKWKYLIEPYVMFPNMNGTVGLGNLPDVAVDANPDDIFSHLKFGAMLSFDAYNDKWAINSDLLYMDLGEDVNAGTFIKSGKVSAKQLGWEVVGLRRVRPWLELGLGFLLNSLESGANINVADLSGGTDNLNKKLTETWVDPMIVARIKSSPDKKFVYQFRGDIGGFGIGSELAYELQLYAGYRFSKLFQLTGGYRVISLDYTNGSGDSRFLYDVRTFGPVIRFGFNF